jgi:hypothetical protein
MAVLQHELQHVLEYASGELTALGYLSNPRHWTYAVRLTPGIRWSDLGAEQRASLAERLWLADHGLAGDGELERLRTIIPWARRETFLLPREAGKVDRRASAETEGAQGRKRS